MQLPFQVGESYLICTATLYYVGRVVEVGFGWIRLADASWVHWTGRLSVLLKQHSFTKGHGSRRPRVEPCGEVVVWVASLVAHYPWPGNLPAEAVE